MIDNVRSLKCYQTKSEHWVAQWGMGFYLTKKKKINAYYTILEWFGLEGNLNIPSSPPPHHGWGGTPPIKSGCSRSHPTWVWTLLGRRILTPSPKAAHCLHKAGSCKMKKQLYITGTCVWLFKEVFHTSQGIECIQTQLETKVFYSFFSSLKNSSWI